MCAIADNFLFLTFITKSKYALKSVEVSSVHCVAIVAISEDETGNCYTPQNQRSGVPARAQL